MTTTGRRSELDAFSGSRPTHAGDTTLESQGMAPIPAGDRYDTPRRQASMWFSPNMTISGVFIGTLAPALGLGFWPGVAAIVAGTLIGSVPVAFLASWGPQTGTAQIPLARMPFGKSVTVPGAVQGLSAIGWLAIEALFGGQAAQLLLHVPFWAGTAVVLAVQGTIAVYGYELVHLAERLMAPVMIVLFLVLTGRIVFAHHLTLAHDTARGGALAGAFVLMVTISLSGSFSWASYGSDYSRYVKASASRTAVFWWTMLGLLASFLWVQLIGLAGASVLSDQTAAGIRALMGGGVAGVLALAAIVLAACVSAPANTYSGSLAFQAIGVRLRRPVIAAVIAAVAFAAAVWMDAGSTAARFENVLLFTAYWLAPFLAVIVIDWHYAKGRYTPGYLRDALGWQNLAPGWAALAAFVIGFAAMVPFMNTSIVEGPAAHLLGGADVAFYAGFIVAGAVYYLLRRAAAGGQAAVRAA